MGVSEAEAVLPLIQDDNRRAYYKGIILERAGKDTPPGRWPGGA